MSGKSILSYCIWYSCISVSFLIVYKEFHLLLKSENQTFKLFPEGYLKFQVCALL